MKSFLHGIVLAFGLILPLGVQNLFVLNQGATQPALIKALPVVLTAALCDTLLILAAVQGVSLLILGFSWFKILLIGIGCVFLVYMGWVTWNAVADSEHEEPPERFSAKQQIMFAAGVSLLNPHAIMDTIGVIGTSSLSYDGKEKWFFTIACILVSWIWFSCLALAGRLIAKHNRSVKVTTLLNKVSAVIIWGSAFYMGYHLK